MDDLKIMLTFDPAHFKEIYYRNGQGSVFTYHPTRKAIIYFLSVTLFTFIIYLVSDTRPDISWLIVPGILGLLYTGITAFTVVSKYQKWKNDFKTYLKKLAHFRSYTVQLTPNAIEVTYDSTIFMDKWGSITSAEISDTHIMLNIPGAEGYFFPAKSMKPGEYSKLKDFIVSKIKEMPV